MQIELTAEEGEVAYEILLSEYTRLQNKMTEVYHHLNASPSPVVQEGLGMLQDKLQKQVTLMGPLLNRMVYEVSGGGGKSGTI